jgi:hypothetical protein
MKVTGFLVSKKLAEIGFKAEAEKCWAKIGHSVSSEFVLVNLDFQVPQNCDEWVLSYDLETLLDVLPHNFILEKKIKFLNMNQSEIGYKTGSSDIYDYQLLYFRMKEESLADTAGRLIILLHEKNLIKF